MITDVLTSQNITIITALFMNVPTHVTVLDEAFASVIGILVDVVIECSDKFEKKHFIGALNWLSKTLPHELSPYLERIRRFF